MCITYLFKLLIWLITWKVRFGIRKREKIKGMPKHNGRSLKTCITAIRLRNWAHIGCIEDNLSQLVKNHIFDDAHNKIIKSIIVLSKIQVLGTVSLSKKTKSMKQSWAFMQEHVKPFIRASVIRKLSYSRFRYTVILSERQHPNL